jgi:hypothetical protein
MALLWMDGFDHYSAGAQSQRMYESGSIWTMNTSFPRTGSQCATPYYSEPGLEKFLGVNAAVLIVGVACYRDDMSYPSAWVVALRFKDSATEQCRLERGPAGRLRFYGNNTLLAESADNVYPLRSWHYLEVKVVLGAPGSFEVRINGRTVLSGSGRTTSTANNYANWVGLRGQAQDYIDDLYICDNTGTQNADFLGDVKVVTILPNADGSNTGWTPSSGTAHYAVVDEAPANDDTDYLYTSTVGATDTENFQDVSLTGSILGVLQLACLRKDDAGSREAALICRSGGSDYEGPQVALGNSYTYLKQLRESDPATGVAWTVTGLNAAQFGVRMRA